MVVVVVAIAMDASKYRVLLSPASIILAPIYAMYVVGIGGGDSYMGCLTARAFVGSF